MNQQITLNLYTLSVILNMHRENELISKTIDNLYNILEFTKKNKPNWTNIEIIAVLDNSNDITKNIIYSHKHLFSNIEEVNYCDLSDSRNHGIKTAKNNFILFADGDDYSSHNSFLLLYNEFYKHYTINNNIINQTQLANLEYSKQLAVFPELLIAFPKLSFNEYTNSNKFIIANMCFTHCYISRICCPKFLLEHTLLRKNTLPYGFEDWDLNNRLLSLGVKYKIAKDYVLYYRKISNQSLLQKQLQNKCIVRNSNIYNLPELTSNNNFRSNSFIKLIKKTFSRFISYFFQNKKINYHYKFLLSYKENSRILQFTRFIALFSNINILSSSYNQEVLAFSKIKNELTHKKIILIVSCATLKDLNSDTIKYLASFGNDTTIINTVKSVNFINKVCTYISLQHINSFINSTNEQKLHILLKSIINNSSIKELHIIQSDLGLQLVKNYSKVFHEHNIKVATI